ncbi:MAG: phosphoglycerate kinase [Helicobacteraceae bacterium]|jgi:phosphoglycerate kinase|nr:phosphoglycerate kinase [Helicobacteraceae bacterium]
MTLRTIKDIEIAGKKVFIRCDFNVPQDEFGNITDDRRIRSALATINYCVDHNCAVILASHNGRPKGEFDAKYTLAPIAKRLQTLLKRDVILSADVIGADAAGKSKALKSGEILLLENLRFEKGETKNDDEFAKKLADMAEIYINDAFGVSHRAHASVEAITNFFADDSKAAGFLLNKEINFFDRTLQHPTRPFIAVIGGSKVSGKLQALENLLQKVDKMIVGGGMAFTFLKALGEQVGDSLVEDELIPDALRIMDEAKKRNVKFYLPVDVVCAQSIDANAVTIYTTTKEIPFGWKGLDIGPATTRLFREALDGAQTILWNGPMGVFEIDKFAKGSFKISHRIAESHATKIVGGGDTADVVQRADDADEMTFISTGGGASLELLEGKILPGVKALEIKEEV